MESAEIQLSAIAWCRAGRVSPWSASWKKGPWTKAFGQVEDGGQGDLLGGRGKDRWI